MGTNSVAKGFSSDFLGLKRRKMFARVNPLKLDDSSLKTMLDKSGSKKQAVFPSFYLAKKQFLDQVGQPLDDVCHGTNLI